MSRKAKQATDDKPKSRRTLRIEQTAKAMTDAEKILRCDVCKTLFIFAQSSWVCPAGLDHSKMISERIAVEMLAKKMGVRPSKNYPLLDLDDEVGMNRFYKKYKDRSRKLLIAKYGKRTTKEGK